MVIYGMLTPSEVSYRLEFTQFASLVLPLAQLSNERYAARTSRSGFARSVDMKGCM